MECSDLPKNLNSFLEEYLEKIGDDSKEIMENDYKTNAESGVAIGVHVMSPWSDDSEHVKFKNEMIEKYRNVDANHVKLYEESLRSEEIELRSEEPVCTQDLYGLLDNLIQEVYSNENKYFKIIRFYKNKLVELGVMRNLYNSYTSEGQYTKVKKARIS